MAPQSLTEFAGRGGTSSCWVCNLDKQDESGDQDIRRQVEEGARGGIGHTRIASWLFKEYNISVNTTTAGRNHLAKHMREHPNVGIEASTPAKSS